MGQKTCTAKWCGLRVGRKTKNSKKGGAKDRGGVSRWSEEEW